MPVEGEREQGEVSVKVDFENATEIKQEVVEVPTTTKEDDVVVNGISHVGNNGNGNDTDGSYVFITENDTVGDDSDSVKPVDLNVVEKDLKVGDNANSGDVKVEEAMSSADDVVSGVSQDSQTLEKSEPEKADDGPEEEVVGIVPKSEIEDSLAKSVDEENLGNGHLEKELEGKLESTEEVKQLQDSEVGPRDLTKNIAEEKPEDKIESEIKTDVEGHQGDIIETQEKSDVDVDVSEDLKHNEDVAKDPVDSDQGSVSKLASAKVSPTDPDDRDMGLGQVTLADPADTINGSESVNDRSGSESVAVLESVPVENGHPPIESESEKTGDVPFTSEAEKVNAFEGDVLPDSGSVEVAVSEVSSDVPAETQTLTAASLDAHTPGIDSVVENGNIKSESEADIGAVDDVSVSDGSINTHQDDPTYDQEGKQHIESEVKELLDAPASEERSDAVIVAKEKVSEAAISDGLSCTNQQEPERDEKSGLVEKLPSHVLHENAPSGNDTSVNVSDDSKSQSLSEGVDTNQKIQDDCSAQLEEVANVNVKHAPNEKVQENNSERNLSVGGDVCLNSAEEAKESPTEDLSGNASLESAETLSTNIKESLSLLDSKAAVSDLAESSAEGVVGETGAVATESEAAQSVEECSEPHIAPSTIEFGEINREVNCGSEVNVTKTPPVDVCEDIPPNEVSEMKESDIKEKSSINADEEVGTASVASEIKTCAQDLESKEVTSTTEAKDSVDSQPAENKDGNAVDGTDGKVASTCDGSAHDASEAHTVAVEIEKRPFYFLPRVPRYVDENLAEQLEHAEAQVDQKTQSRDALRADIQKIRAICKDYDISYKAAMAEERSARKAMHSKRQEIDTLQSVISRVKSAASVDDIDSRVHNMEHLMQHSTISLTEEKGFMREIKQLKQLRAQISSSMGTTDEVKQALDEKEKTEERLKVLRKELDGLRNDLSKVEAITKAAKKKCDEEWEAQSKLQEQFRAAAAVRQEAFVHLQDLKKQQREKNKYFFKYKDNSRAASEMALKKDRAALQSLCSDQVENFMNMWNNDEEFRKYYVRCNTRSTFKRLGTLDGRSLGPDEEPPRITYATRTDKLRSSSDRAEKHEAAPPVPAQQEKVIKYEGSKVENNSKAAAKPTEQKSQTTKSKKAVKADQPPPIVTKLDSGKEEIEKSETKEEEEPPKLTKEEEELIKKEEEKRKQKEAAKMKEQHRLEEIAKAKEAMERKKKREEKAKARALLKAQKEAEEREKEREKKLRKKERRKGIFTSEEAAAEAPIPTSETVVETPREIEIPKKQTIEESQQIKKSHKPSSQFLKQNKSKSVPLPLRNRGNKRKLRQWMWIGLIVVVILALFLLGNANLSFSSANLWFT
ncbi:PREDICTED: calponin homology domain-containing protein DDB_G0272472-like [Camelina sativa]|uniref:Calponin homology domain-containing protein DDB_G0272472-like n=1 Tax=Camelina sativa TaxID=90675 RepID=A0ABM0YBI8_CAMSA|nr:PREDICTED: calponin homology domain-containing protein DDB_G0272472-like [Camelina sativa]